MSSTFYKNLKELSVVKIIDSSKVYVYNSKTKKCDLPNPKYNFLGKIDTRLPNYIIKYKL